MLTVPSHHRESAAHSPPTPPAIFKCLHELKSTKLSKSQKEAINSMLDPACQQVLSGLPVAPPYLCVCIYRYHLWCWVHLDVARHAHSTSV